MLGHSQVESTGIGPASPDLNRRGSHSTKTPNAVIAAGLEPTTYSLTCKSHYIRQVEPSGIEPDFHGFQPCTVTRPVPELHAGTKRLPSFKPPKRNLSL